MVFLSQRGDRKSYITGGYYETIYKADSLFISGKPKEAYNVLNEIFKQFIPINLPYIEEYKTYVKSQHLIGLTREARHSLKQLIRNYGITWNKINKDDVLLSLVVQSGFTRSDYEVLRLEYEQSTLTSLKMELDTMYNEDRDFRRKYMETPFKNKIDSIDQVHALRLVEIFKKHGYPMPKKLGLTDNTKNFDRKTSILLLHTKEEIRENYFIPFIKESVEKGNCVMLPKN